MVLIMAEKMPKMGERIPVEKFHISKMNVRYGEPFGESEKDKRLMANLRKGKIVQAFKTRPEGDGYGVVVGRRRFLAEKEVGVKHFVVGVDCLIENMSDEEAREASLTENLEILREELDPVVRARQLSEHISSSPTGLRGVARRMGIPASTLSEWLKVLELSEKMQESLSKGQILFTDGLQVARMKLGAELQDDLAELAETEGHEAFKRELVRVASGKMKRGIPKGMYIILRTTFDKRNKRDMELYEKLLGLAKRNDMKIDEYYKWALTEHIKSTA